MSRSDRDREFEEFVAAAWPRLRRAAYLLTHNSHDAEDLVQGALARSYANWGRVRRDGAYSYVHRALVNGYIDSTRRRTPVPVAEVHEAASDDGPLDRSDRRSELTDSLLRCRRANARSSCGATTSTPRRPRSPASSASPPAR